MRKILFLILLLMASHTFADDNTFKGSDSSIIHYDTIVDTTFLQTIKVKIDSSYQYDTTVAVAKQIVELKGEFYDQAMKSIEFKMSFANIIMGIIGLLVALFAGYSTYVSISSKKEVKEQLAEGRKLINEEIEKIKLLKKEAIKDSESIKDIKKQYEELDESTTISSQKAEAEATTKGITDPEKRLELINVDDAVKAIEAYENLLFDMEVQKLPRDIIPTSLHRKVGLYYKKLKNYNSAETEFELYLDKYPDDKHILFNLGYILSGQYELSSDISYLIRADKIYKRYEKIDNENINDKHAFYNWGLDLLDLFKRTTELKYLKKSIIKFEKTLELSPTHHKAIFNIACAYSLLEKKELMLKNLEVAIKFDSKYKKMAIDDDDFEKYKKDEKFIALTKEDSDDEVGDSTKE